MRLTDDRYATEKTQFELALRMIRHEARTRTIRACTGLSDDRIRKLYGTYFRDNGQVDVKRRRGKSPRQVTLFVKNPLNQLEATTRSGRPVAGSRSSGGRKIVGSTVFEITAGWLSPIPSSTCFARL